MHYFTNIFYNLFDNSIKYCDKDPKITINIKEENNQIKIDFIDNGETNLIWTPGSAIISAASS